MKLIVLGSDSSGNGYVLIDTPGNALVVEAGVRLLDLKKALNFRINKVAGCIISHSHHDHARHALEYRKTGISMYMSPDTRKEVFGETRHYNTHELQEQDQVTVGPFLIRPFKLQHDVTNYGYLIHHHEMGLACFLTDTHYCPYTFKGLTNILVECNYSLPILDQRVSQGMIPPVVRDRIIYSHMELQTTKDFLRANDLKRVNNIVLLHLSQGNSDRKRYRKEIGELTGKNVEIALKGLTMELNRTGV